MRALRIFRPSRLVSFAEGLALQRTLIRECREEGWDSLVLLQHTPTYTAGRRESGFSGRDGQHLKQATGAASFDIDRGGQITFHGPGQLVIYPILDLGRFKPSLHWYVERLGQVMIKTCQALGVPDVICKDSVGVWVEGLRKIGFIGFRNSKWIVSHGISLNVCNDLSYFKHIVPCGDPQAQVTSIATELGRCGEAVDQDLLMRMAALHMQHSMLSELSVDRVREADLDEFMLARQALGTQEVLPSIARLTDGLRTVDYQQLEGGPSCLDSLLLSTNKLVLYKAMRYINRQLIRNTMIHSRFSIP